MKKFLSGLINHLHKKDLDLLYGEGSYVKINNIRYSTNNHNYCIDCVIYIKDLDLFEESGVSALNYLFEESWKFTGYSNYKPILITSFDVI